MTAFAQRAQQLLEAAKAAAHAGARASEITVLIGYDGSIQLCADSDWPLESLARERGAQAAYRVTRSGGGVRVEGRQGSQSCILESKPEQHAIRDLLRSCS